MPRDAAADQGPSMHARFRKKPVEIEAIQWDGTRASIEACCQWVNGFPPLHPDHDEPTLSYLFTRSDDVSDVQIWTLEGPHSVSPGDWIIRGVKGEFYACKPDVFDMTYEPVAA
jgi:hypothetical protein